MGEKSRTGHLCQFHTASPAHESYIAAEGPQIWRGTMTIAFRHDQLLATVARLRTMALEAPLVGTHCAVLPAPDGLRSWHAATHCNTLAAHCSTLQHTATHCNTLQHTATHCNTLQPCAVLPAPDGLRSCCTATHCNTLQHTATHCNTLPHTATHCNTDTGAMTCLKGQVDLLRNQFATQFTQLQKKKCYKLTLTVNGYSDDFYTHDHV